MITKDDLENWEMENEEDVICDGPYHFDDKKLCDAIRRNSNFAGIKTTPNMANMDSMELIESIIDNCDTQTDIDNFREVVLDSCVEILNKEEVDVELFR